MGWKNVKEHYGIDAIVTVQDGILRMGSAYISDIVTITPDGRIIKCDYRGSSFGRCVDEIEQDPATFASLMAAPDSFEKSIVVYTYQDDQIIEKLCEELDWPNVTHDGELMYENSHFSDRAKAVAQAKVNLEARIENCEYQIADLEGQLDKFHIRQAEAQQMLQGLVKRESL